MSNEIEADKGDSIYHAARKAIEHAKRINNHVYLKFNDFRLTVSPESYLDDICIIYSLKCDLAIAKLRR